MSHFAPPAPRHARLTLRSRPLPVRAFAMPPFPAWPPFPPLPPVSVPALGHAAAAVGLSVAAALVSRKRTEPPFGPLKLAHLDVAAGCAAALGALLAVNHACLGHLPPWVLPAAVMGVVSLLPVLGDLRGPPVAIPGTLMVWLMVACFEGMLNLRLPMELAMPLVTVLPSVSTSDSVVEAHWRSRP